MSEETTENTPTVGAIEFPVDGGNDVHTNSTLVINAIKCIDAAANRGAFHGGELSTVGGVRDQLYVLVKDEVEEMVAKEKATAEAAGTVTTDNA
jgi:hypothetical protein